MKFPFGGKKRNSGSDTREKKSLVLGKKCQKNEGKKGGEVEILKAEKKKKKKETSNIFFQKRSHSKREERRKGHWKRKEKKEWGRAYIREKKGK